MNQNLAACWGKVVFFFLCASVALLGIGRLEIPILGLRFSSWSVSRTAFFFWLGWKLWVRAKQGQWEWNLTSVSIPLCLFVGWVTASLLPDFEHLGDYRYFMFAFGHYLMVTDVFGNDRRQTLLYYLLGVTPGFLLFRGIFSDPSVLNVSLTSRFAYPLDHANIAGHLFSMSIPLCLALILRYDRWIRPLAGLSVLCQFSALILTFSRNAWIACSAALLSGCVREKRLRIFISVLALIGLIALGVSSELRDRVWSVTDAMDDPRVVWRIDVMTMAISVGLDSPFLGNGYGRDHLRAALKE
jgi:O-Antigen ligase